MTSPRRIGTGKTGLATALYRALLESGASGFEVTPSGMQIHLFDLDRAEIAKIEALRRVDDHTDGVWREIARQCVLIVVRRHGEFTTDDVWGLLADYAIDQPHEPRAMGPVMLAAVKLGWCRPSGRYVKSGMVSNHARPIAVYESLLLHDA